MGLRGRGDREDESPPQRQPQGGDPPVDLGATLPTFYRWLTFRCAEEARPPDSQLRKVHTWTFILRRSVYACAKSAETCSGRN